ncbi:MAG: YifB family Mg chelatase-like AAA ATPase [Eubacteriales bacterium]|jgi:magnesium chelatase family protein
MVSNILSAGIFGISGYKISVECFLSSGLPSFEIVGLPGTSVRESRERVRAALRNCGYTFPKGRITVNLAPADTKKEGPLYDLPVLLGVLTASGQVPPPPTGSAFIGELSLNGELRPVNGVLPMALAARAAGIKSLYVPHDNASEAALVDGIDIYACSHAGELIRHINGKIPLSAYRRPIEKEPERTLPDFADVKGQDGVKRALEIAAAGGHNVLLVGPPGSGKSMLARRLPSILPLLNDVEAMESTAIHSVAGLVTRDKPLLSDRPFRAPHHTVSVAGLSGGGTIPKPGEITLAHNGVLFLDELPEFDRRSLEILRQPLEEGSIVISRAAGTVAYPSRFMLVCAMNPCRCGWYGHPSHRCVCSKAQVDSYLSKISGPLLDRIDIKVDVPSLEFDDLARKPSGESSALIRRRVIAARKLARERYISYGFDTNAHLPAHLVQELCKPDPSGLMLLRDAFDRLGLTARSYDRVLRLARTIADLDSSTEILAHHIAEALQYRTAGGKIL